MESRVECQQVLAEQHAKRKIPKFAQLVLVNLLEISPSLLKMRFGEVQSATTEQNASPEISIEPERSDRFGESSNRSIYGLCYIEAMRMSEYICLVLLSSFSNVYRLWCIFCVLFLFVLFTLTL